MHHLKWVALTLQAVTFRFMHRMQWAIKETRHPGLLWLLPHRRPLPKLRHPRQNQAPVRKADKKQAPFNAEPRATGMERGGGSRATGTRICTSRTVVRRSSDNTQRVASQHCTKSRSSPSSMGHVARMDTQTAVRGRSLQLACLGTCLHPLPQPSLAAVDSSSSHLSHETGHPSVCIRQPD
jgi:hypothetical protein